MYVSFLRNSAKDKNLRQYTTQKDFITPNHYAENSPGEKIYVSDTCHHQDFTSAQPIKLRFDFKPAVEAATVLN